MTSRPARVARCVGGVALIVAAAACARVPAERPTRLGAGRDAAAVTTPATRIPTPDTPRYVPDAPVLTVAAPARLEIPAIAVSTPLVPLGLEPDGSMEVPADFGRAGWYTGGPAPGASGPAVVAGHIDSTRGPAVFSRLGALRPGDDVRIARVDGTDVHFVVDRLERFAKQAFPTATVFGPTQRPELRLVTCSGDFDFDHRTYRENLVVFARPA